MTPQSASAGQHAETNTQGQGSGRCSPPVHVTTTLRREIVVAACVASANSIRSLPVKRKKSYGLNPGLGPGSEAAIRVWLLAKNLVEPIGELNRLRPSRFNKSIQDGDYCLTHLLVLLEKGTKISEHRIYYVHNLSNG